MTHFRHEISADKRPLEHLYEEAFGPGRFAKAASLMREKAVFLPHFSFVATEDGTGDGTEDGKGENGAILGACQIWGIGAPWLSGDEKACLLGPIAIAKKARGKGLSLALVEKCLAATDRAIAGAFGAAFAQKVILIGEQSLFGRFGFVPMDMTAINLPASVAPGRLLVRVRP